MAGVKPPFRLTSRTGRAVRALHGACPGGHFGLKKGHVRGACAAQNVPFASGPGYACWDCLRQRMPASRNSSISPSSTADGLPTSCSVRRSLTIW